MTAGWAFREALRVMRPVAREVGQLGLAILPWLPLFVGGGWLLQRWPVIAPVLVLITPIYYVLLRGGKVIRGKFDVMIIGLVAIGALLIVLQVERFISGWLWYGVAFVLVISTLVVHAWLRGRKQR
jgi:hypothetical protein